MQDLYPNLSLASNSFTATDLVNFTWAGSDRPCVYLRPQDQLDDITIAQKCLREKPASYDIGGLCQFTDCFLASKQASCQFPFK